MAPTTQMARLARPAHQRLPCRRPQLAQPPCNSARGFGQFQCPWRRRQRCSRRSKASQNSKAGRSSQSSKHRPGRGPWLRTCRTCWPAGMQLPGAAPCSRSKRCCCRPRCRPAAGGAWKPPSAWALAAIPSRASCRNWDWVRDWVRVPGRTQGKHLRQTPGLKKKLQSASSAGAECASSYQKKSEKWWSPGAQQAPWGSLSYGPMGTRRTAWRTGHFDNGCSVNSLWSLPCQMKTTSTAIR